MYDVIWVVCIIFYFLINYNLTADHLMLTNNLELMLQKSLGNTPQTMAEECHQTRPGQEKFKTRPCQESNPAPFTTPQNANCVRIFAKK